MPSVSASRCVSLCGCVAYFLLSSECRLLESGGCSFCWVRMPAGSVSCARIDALLHDGKVLDLEQRRPIDVFASPHHANVLDEEGASNVSRQVLSFHEPTRTSPREQRMQASEGTAWSGACQRRTTASRDLRGSGICLSGGLAVWRSAPCSLVVCSARGEGAQALLDATRHG